MLRSLCIMGWVLAALLAVTGQPLTAQISTLRGDFSHTLEPSGAFDPVEGEHLSSETLETLYVTNAIREASDYTGVDYNYLLATAQIESGLNPQARAKTSSATGLYQFIESTWLANLDRHAGQFGLTPITDSHFQRAAWTTGQTPSHQISTRQALLDMRRDPRFAALMAAAATRENKRELHRILGDEVTSADLYLAHFLGSSGAAHFLRTWSHTPHTPAARLFPKAARANTAIFYTRSGRARTLEAVRDLISQKIERASRAARSRDWSSRVISFDSENIHVSQHVAPTSSKYIEGKIGGASGCRANAKSAGSGLQFPSIMAGAKGTYGRQGAFSAPKQKSSLIQRPISHSSGMTAGCLTERLSALYANNRMLTIDGLTSHNPCDHIEMCYVRRMSTSTITRVRELVNSGEMTRAGLARAAGLHANTLRDASEDDWNPTAETLQKLEMFLDSNDERPVLVGIEEIIDEARNGKMYILVDDEDRENEGDLIIPAQMATPAAINFMATHGRGLICLALDRDRVDTLGLEPMSRNNKESMQTAFTISIEAKEGVTTGISAADRARTVSVAIDSTKNADDIVTPGHVFPLAARDGGTLVRAGHTEAAVDISRLAGLNPSGVICEIMNEDGTMARLDDLVEFARLHDLKIGTIRDLIAYRMRNDHLVERLSENAFESDYGGQWRLITYRDRIANEEAYVLQKGHVIEGEPTLARVHPISVFDDVLGAPGPRQNTLQRAMSAIGEHGSGVIVILTSRVGSGGEWTKDEEIRNIGIGSQILADLGVHDMVLLSNSRPDLVALEGFGITITDFKPIA